MGTAVALNGWNQGELYAFHPSLCNVVMGDGSVRALSATITMDTLQKLAAQRELLHRQVTIAVRDRRGPGHTIHRASEAVRALAACEVTATVLDGPDAAATTLEDPLGDGRRLVDPCARPTR